MTKPGSIQKSWSLAILHQADRCPRNTIVNNINDTLIRDWLQPGLTIAEPTIGHWDVSDKYETSVQKINKIRITGNISFESGNNRKSVASWETKRADKSNGQVSLEHTWTLQDELENFGEISTDNGHKVLPEEKRTDISMWLDFMCIRTW